MISIIAIYDLISRRAGHPKWDEGGWGGNRILMAADGAFLRASTNQFVKKQRPGLVLALLPGSAPLFSAREGGNKRNHPEAR